MAARQTKAEKEAAAAQAANELEGRRLERDDAVALAEADKAASEERVAKELEQGYRGSKVDPRDNADYTVAGVTGDNAPATHEAGRATQADIRDVLGRAK